MGDLCVTSSWPPPPDKGQLNIFFSLVSLYNLSKNEYSIFLPLWWVNYVRPHAGPHPLGPLNILFLLVSFHIIPKKWIFNFPLQDPIFSESPLLISMENCIFNYSQVYPHEMTMKNIKRGGSLDKFLLQILFPHWSKWKAHDRILGSDWSREDMIQLKATAPKENDVIKTNISTFIFLYWNPSKLHFILFPEGNANIQFKACWIFFWGGEKTRLWWDQPQRILWIEYCVSTQIPLQYINNHNWC